MKEKGNLGWDGSLAAPPSCASASRFTRLGSSPSSCFLYLQTILGEGMLVHQRPHYGGRGCTMVTESAPWWQPLCGGGEPSQWAEKAV